MYTAQKPKAQKPKDRAFVTTVFKPVSGSVLFLLLAVLTFRQSGGYRDMETLWRTTISANPQSSMAHNNLGLLLFRRGSVNESMYYLEKAAALDPLHAEAHNNLGSALRVQGRLNEAIAQFREASELEPRSGVYRANLASALTEAGNIAEAIAQYELAVKASPSDPFIANNLAWLLATSPQVTAHDSRRAVELAERSARISTEDPIARGTLAAAYAAAGRFSEAAAQAEKSRELALRQGNHGVRDLADQMLKAYRAGQIYR
jgi:spermidine synthase